MAVEGDDWLIITLEWKVGGGKSGGSGEWELGMVSLRTNYGCVEAMICHKHVYEMLASTD